VLCANVAAQRAAARAQRARRRRAGTPWPPLRLGTKNEKDARPKPTRPPRARAASRAHARRALARRSGAPANARGAHLSQRSSCCLHASPPRAPPSKAEVLAFGAATRRCGCEAGLACCDAGACGGTEGGRKGELCAPIFCCGRGPPPKVPIANRRSSRNAAPRRAWRSAGRSRRWTRSTRGATSMPAWAANSVRVERVQSVRRHTQVALTHTRTRARAARQRGASSSSCSWSARPPRRRTSASSPQARAPCLRACIHGSVGSHSPRTLSPGEHGACADSGTPLCYAGSALARIAPGEALYGGALVTAGGAADGAQDGAAASAAAAAAPPDGRHSAYGRFFEPDADSLAHDRAGTAHSGWCHHWLCVRSLAHSAPLTFSQGCCRRKRCATRPRAQPRRHARMHACSACVRSLHVTLLTRKHARARSLR
jgi:hypothetical protein